MKYLEGNDPFKDDKKGMPKAPATITEEELYDEEFVKEYAPLLNFMKDPTKTQRM